MSLHITWLGHAAFKIETSAETIIVTDPYSEKTGYTMPRVIAGLVTISHQHYDHNYVEGIEGSPEVVDRPGEFTIKDIAIEGIPSFHDEVKGEKRGKNIIFKFYADGLTLAHMGDYGQSLTQEQLSSLAGIDILFVPVGGNYTIDAARAAEIVEKIAPKVVIPMHYKTADVVINLERVDAFVDKMQRVKRIGSSLEITKAELPPKTEVWVMEYIQA